MKSRVDDDENGELTTEMSMHHAQAKKKRKSETGPASCEQAHVWQVNLSAEQQGGPSLYGPTQFLSFSRSFILFTSRKKTRGQVSEVTGGT